MDDRRAVKRPEIPKGCTREQAELLKSIDEKLDRAHYIGGNTFSVGRELTDEEIFLVGGVFGGSLNLVDSIFGPDAWIYELLIKKTEN